MSLKELIKFFYKKPFFEKIFHTTNYCLRNELSNCESVLDLGCGPSSPIASITWLKHTVGVDGYEEYIKVAKRNGTHDEFILGDIKNLEFEEKSFDAVLLIEVLEHLEKPDAVKLLEKAEKWARKKLIITTPNGFVNQSVLDNNVLQTHLSGWSVEDLTNLGFSKVLGLAGIKHLRKGKGENDSMDDDLAISIRYRPKIFWFVIATVSQLLTYKMPKLSFELFAVKFIQKPKYSEDYYKQYEYGFQNTNREDHKRILEVVDFKDKKVLDYGCGYGTLLSLIDVGGGEKYGLETNDFAVDYARGNGLNVGVLNESFEIPYAHGFFDTIIMNEVIEHIKNPGTSLDYISSFLKIGGEIVITTPNKNILVKNLDETHFSEMTFNELEHLIREKGFIVDLHEVSGFSVWDYMGRKIIYPLGKKISRSGIRVSDLKQEGV